jgi:cyclophilin family peptidyl-prolyl cis-trans isomerase
MASGRPPAGTPGRSPKRSGNTTLAVLGLGSVAVLVAAGVIAFGNPFGSASPSDSPSSSGEASAATYGDGTCPTSQPEPLAATDRESVTIETDLGNIVIEVDGARAPIATGNFIALVECHYYDDVVFHRLVPDFVIQGGDPSGTGAGRGPGYRIADDPLVGTYKRGTVAMARSSGPNSQGSQFFIVLADSANAALTDPQNAPYPYAILGEVTSGMDVVDAIAAMPNSGGQSGNMALDPVTMNAVYVGAPGGSPAPSPAASAAPSAASTQDPASPSAAPSQ